MGKDVSIYGRLDKQAQAVARSAVEKITSLQGRLVTDIADIGSELIRAKEAVGHGNFGPWLKAEFNWTERTAQNFMAVAERFGSNPKPVSHLPLATVYRLAAPSTPDNIREKILTRLEGGEVVDPVEIADELSQARREAERARKLARLTPAQRAKKQAALDRSMRQRKQLAERHVVEREARKVKTSSAAALIVAAMDSAQFGQLLGLLEDGIYIDRVGLIAARKRTYGHGGA